MHPAPSIIFFTVLSGFGFGSLFFLGIGSVPASGLQAFWLFAIAAGSATLGLLASVFHLGHPERALKAFSQWRTSWLSREGWLASITLVLAAAFGGLIVFFDQFNELLGQFLAGAAVLTILATSMIYAQLKTVPRWNDFTTPILFLAAGLTSGSFLVPGFQTIGFLALFGLLQGAVWYRGANRFAARGHTLGAATGLGPRGAVRAFEPPHTGTNYLLNEMVHIVGRRHARRLKYIALALISVIPIAILLVVDVPETRVVALAVHLLGMLTSRWMFFAEAEHVVGLFYGKR